MKVGDGQSGRESVLLVVEESVMQRYVEGRNECECAQLQDGEVLVCGRGGCEEGEVIKTLIGYDKQNTSIARHKQ